MVKKKQNKDRSYVSLPPEIHRRAKSRAAELDISLQEFTAEALRWRISNDSEWHDTLQQILASNNTVARKMAMEGLRAALENLTTL